jgi:hypothetical protein
MTGAAAGALTGKSAANAGIATATEIAPTTNATLLIENPQNFSALCLAQLVDRTCDKIATKA